MMANRFVAQIRFNETLMAQIRFNETLMVRGWEWRIFDTVKKVSDISGCTNVFSEPLTKNQAKTIGLRVLEERVGEFNPDTEWQTVD